MDRQLKYMLCRFMGRILSKREEIKTASKPKLNSFKSILTLRPDRLGDVVLSIPIYESIKRSLPQAQVTVLVQAGPAKILENNPFVDHIILFNPQMPWKALRELKATNFDLAIVLNQIFSATATIMALFSGAPWRAGYANKENENIFNIRIPIPKVVKQEVEHNLDVLRYMNFPIIAKSPVIFPDAAMEKHIDNILKKIRSNPNRPLILIKPGSRLEKWGWPLNKFKTLCAKIREKELGETLLIKGPGEESLISSFLAGMDPPPKVLPRLDIKELSYVIKKANLLICNHTGIMHVASAVKTSILAIFKHGDVKRWGPYDVPHIILEERENDELTPDTVLKSVCTLLNTQTLKKSSNLSHKT